MIYRTIVQNWHYNDGWRDIPFVLSRSLTREREFDEELVGWHCWVYAGNDCDFRKWMEENMTGPYECDFRFNSGDPMHTVQIKSEEDATLFKLRWLT